jgi:hypothetical protein
MVPRSSPWHPSEQVKDKLYNLHTGKESHNREMNILVQLAIIYCGNNIESNILRPRNPATMEFAVSTEKYRQDLKVLSYKGLVQVFQFKEDYEQEGSVYLRIPDYPVSSEDFQKIVISWAVRQLPNFGLIFRGVLLRINPDRVSHSPDDWPTAYTVGRLVGTCVIWARHMKKFYRTLAQILRQGIAEEMDGAGVAGILKSMGYNQDRHDSTLVPLCIMAYVTKGKEAKARHMYVQEGSVTIDGRRL